MHRGPTFPTPVLRPFCTVINALGHFIFTVCTHTNETRSCDGIATWRPSGSCDSFPRMQISSKRKCNGEKERERERTFRYTSAWSNNCWKNNNCFYRREYIATAKPASPRLVQHVISSTFDYFRTFFHSETFRLEFVWLTKILPLELIFLTIFIWRFVNLKWKLLDFFFMTKIKYLSLNLLFLMM